MFGAEERGFFGASDDAVPGFSELLSCGSEELWLFGLWNIFGALGGGELRFFGGSRVYNSVVNADLVLNFGAVFFHALRGFFRETPYPCPDRGGLFGGLFSRGGAWARGDAFTGGGVFESEGGTRLESYSRDAAAEIGSEKSFFGSAGDAFIKTGLLENGGRAGEIFFMPLLQNGGGDLYGGLRVRGLKELGGVGISEFSDISEMYEISELSEISELRRLAGGNYTKKLAGVLKSEIVGELERRFARGGAGGFDGFGGLERLDRRAVDSVARSLGAALDRCAEGVHF